MAGPLAGIRIVEFAGIGPGPFCGMMLADHGAEVIRIDRASGTRGGSQPVTSRDVLARGRKSIAIDLKSGEGVARARTQCASASRALAAWRTVKPAPTSSPQTCTRTSSLSSTTRISPPCSGSGFEGGAGRGLRSSTGKSSSKVVPSPGRLDTLTSPPHCCMKPFTIARPRPEPEPTPLVVK